MQGIKQKFVVTNQRQRIYSLEKLGNVKEKYDGGPLVSRVREGFGNGMESILEFSEKVLRESYWKLTRLCFILKQKHLLCKINEGEGGKPVSALSSRRISKI